MRILHVVTTISRGGAENHLMDLARRQARAGDELEVAFLKEDGYWREEMEAQGIRVVPLRMRRYGDPRPLFRLRSRIRDFRPDVIHAHMPPAELYARLALAGIPARSLPLVITKHNDEPFFRGRGQGWLGIWTARRASRVIAISDAVRRYVLERSRAVDADRLDVIHYGLDSSPYVAVGGDSRRRVRSAWGIPEGTLVIGTVARLVPQKDHAVLLQAFAKFAAATPDQARLVIVGRGPLECELKDRAEELGISRATVFAGFREDIPAVMGAFDIFALSSAYEGFGLVLLEAMAAGLPIVATRVSAIPEVVAEGETGRLVAPGDPAAMAQAFLAFRAEAVRARFGRAGRERVLNTFNPDSMATRTRGVYERALGKGSLGPVDAWTATATGA